MNVDWRSRLSAGRLALDGGDLPRATAFMEEALQLARASNAKQGVSEALNALSVCYARQGRLEHAASLLREAIELESRAPSPDVNAARNNLANVLLGLGRTDEARALLHIVLMSATRDREPLNWALAQNNLAIIATEKNDFESAELHLRQASEAMETTFGPNHPRSAEILRNLGTVLAAERKTDEARVVLERAQTIFDGALGGEHPQSLAVAKMLREIAA